MRELGKNGFSFFFCSTWAFLIWSPFSYTHGKHSWGPKYRSWPCLDILIYSGTHLFIYVWAHHCMKQHSKIWRPSLNSKEYLLSWAKLALNFYAFKNHTKKNMTETKRCLELSIAPPTCPNHVAYWISSFNLHNFNKSSNLRIQDISR